MQQNMSDEEHKEVVEFWEYCQPVEMYNVLAQRARGTAAQPAKGIRERKPNPLFLKRTLSYHQLPSTSHSESRHCCSLELSLSELKARKPASVFAAVCEALPEHGASTSQAAPSRMRFRPLAVRLLHLSPGDSAGELATTSAQAEFPELETGGGLDGGGEGGRELWLVLMVWENHKDMTILRKRQGTSLNPRVVPRAAFGLLPCPVLVQWESVRLAELLSRRHSDSQEVQLKLATLNPHSSSADPASASAAARADPKAANFLTFSKGPHPTPAVIKKRMGLRVALRRRAAVADNGGAGTGVERTESGASRKRKRQSMEGASSQAEDGVVFFRYIYNAGAKYVLERTTGWSCPFCCLKARSYLGLQQHLEACHDLFRYGFSEDVPGAVPTVNTCVAEGVHVGGEFQMADAEELKEATKKDYRFYCPLRARRFRHAQYAMAERERAASVPAYLACPWPARLDIASVCREPPADTLDDSCELDGPAPAERRRRTGPRVRGGSGSGAFDAAHSRAMAEAWRFFHAQSATPMQEGEVAAIAEDPKSVPDSDDDEDLDEWKERSRRKLAARPDLPAWQADFMFLWNLHLHNRPLFADTHTPTACRDFAEEHASQLAANPLLRRAFSLHLVTLWEFALLDAASMRDCLRIVDETGLEGRAGGQGADAAVGASGAPEAAVQPQDGNGATTAEPNAGAQPSKATCSPQNGKSSKQAGADPKQSQQRHPSGLAAASPMTGPSALEAHAFQNGTSGFMPPSQRQAQMTVP